MTSVKSFIFRLALSLFECAVMIALIPSFINPRISPLFSFTPLFFIYLVFSRSNAALNYFMFFGYCQELSSTRRSEASDGLIAQQCRTLGDDEADGTGSISTVPRLQRGFRRQSRSARAFQQLEGICTAVELLRAQLGVVAREVGADERISLKRLIRRMQTRPSAVIRLGLGDSLQPPPYHRPFAAMMTATSRQTPRRRSR